MLWVMASGKRESLRQHAIDMANLSTGDSAFLKRLDWEKFHRTGEMRTREQMPPHPLLQQELDKITANGGKFQVPT